MLHIGKTYLQNVEGQARLCADITLNGKGTTLWFGVESAQKSYLCTDRSDAFVMALLPTAMREKCDITCDTPLSERLHYQLQQYLIPTLSAAGDLYHPIAIHAPLTAEPIQTQGGVGTGFSAGVDCLYTIMTHSAGSTYPLTHIAIFNHGVFEGTESRAAFQKACRTAKTFAADQHLDVVGLDSNVQQVLPERYLDVYSFRNLCCAMALQGLFSNYLLSSGHDAANFSFDLHNSSTYDLLTVPCARTESLTFYLSGSQLKRHEKLAALSDWSIAHQWLHPCFRSGSDSKNCSRCHKCTWDMTTLYALGTLERFDAVFDVASFKRALPQRIGFLLANRGQDLFDGPLSLLEENHVPIPPSAYIFEKQFRLAMDNLREKRS